MCTHAGQLAADGPMEASTRTLLASVRRFTGVAVAALIAATASGCGGPGIVSATPASACERTAAVERDWGVPNREDGFDTAATLSNWHLYQGSGHAGNGKRTPQAISVSNGVLTITGNASGYSGGMGWNEGQLFGRWEVCVRSPQSAPGYHSVALMWPDAEDWPVGGELDFMEAVDSARQRVEGWLHYGPDDRRVGDQVSVDATRWHAWAVEWTPQRITYFLDGAPWWSTTETPTFPPRSLHLCLQVDNFGGDIAAGGRQLVDWVRQYSLT
jgi:licheninase